MPRPYQFSLRTIFLAVALAVLVCVVGVAMAAGPALAMGLFCLEVVVGAAGAGISALFASVGALPGPRAHAVAEGALACVLVGLAIFMSCVLFGPSVR